MECFIGWWGWSKVAEGSGVDVQRLVLEKRWKALLAEGAEALGRLPRVRLGLPKPSSPSRPLRREV